MATGNSTDEGERQLSLLSAESSASSNLDSFFSCESGDDDSGEGLMDAFCDGFEAAKETSLHAMPSLVTRTHHLLAYLHGLGVSYAAAGSSVATLTPIIVADFHKRFTTGRACNGV